MRWGRVTPATVTIFHKTGVATIPLGKLPPDLQKQLGYDSQKAAEWTKIETKAALERARARSRRARNNRIKCYPNTLRPNLPSGVHIDIATMTGSSGAIMPFERVQFQLTFEDPGFLPETVAGIFISFPFRADPRSTAALSPGRSWKRAKTYASGDAGKYERIEWRPVKDLLPPQTGTYDIQVVLDTPEVEWATPDDDG